MKFNIRDIGPDGLHVRRALDDAGVRELYGPSDVELGPGPAELTLDVVLARTEAAASVIVVKGALRASFEVACSRCLAPARIEADEPDLRLTFFPPAPRVTDEELSPDDLDTYTYDGEEIDLDPLLREFVILAIPMAPVCKEECKGICGGCGADLNKEPCRCAGTQEEASPWAAALRRLKKT